MIYYDITKSGAAGHSSGIMRVNRRVLAGLGDGVLPVIWKKGHWVDAANKRAVIFRAEDWLLTTELFCEDERPGLWDFIRSRPCRLAAVFHDAIPLRFPHITWPQSVARHPVYLSMLAQFDCVLAISEESSRELAEFWQWQGGAPRAVIRRITLGADLDGVQREVGTALPEGIPAVLCIGILEPRKNQMFLLDVCEALWGEGLAFELHLVGRVNPHFGKQIEARVKQLRKRYSGLKYHQAVGDAEVQALYRRVRAAVFPTIAEGCGLPPLEAMWLGVPCVLSDLAVLREHEHGGGCVFAPVNDLPRWTTALRDVLTDDACAAQLRQAVVARALPTWAETAAMIRRELV